MFDRLVRSRRRAQSAAEGEATAGGEATGPTAAPDRPPGDAPGAPADGVSAAAATAAAAPLGPTVIDPTKVEPAAPEQPVPLPAIPSARRARIGVVLPARRSLLPALSLPVPRVPKRAILAVGICAGLAAPAVTRQLAGRALMAALGPGRPPTAPPAASAPWEATTVEIIRISSAGQRPGQAATVVGKLLEQLTR